MSSRRRADRDRVHRPFADPLDTFTQNPSRPSRTQRHRAEAERRRQAERDVDRLAAGHDAPRGQRLLIYGLLIALITIIGWRMTHWLVYFTSVRPLSGGGAIVGRSGRDIIASGFENPPPPAAWIDPVGLAVGLALGLLITWIYARYFQNL